MFKLNLRRKIFISYMVLVLILAFISSQAIKSLSQLGTQMDLVIQQNYRSILAAQNMIKALELHQSSEWMLIAGKRKEAKDEFNKGRDEFTHWLEEARKNVNQDNQESLKEIETAYYQYVDLYQWLEQYVNQRDASKLGYYSRATRLQRDKIHEMALSLLETNRQDILKISQQSRDISTRYIQSLLIFSIIGVIGGISIGFWLTNIIVKPIEKLTRAVTEIRKGNLDISVDTEHTDDEIGILAQEFNKMTERIKSYQHLNLEKLIEEKKRTEAILRSVGDGMIVIDPAYKIIMVNPTAERIFYLIPGISHGRDFRDIIKSEALFNIIQAYIDGRAGKFRTLPTFEWEYDRMKKHYQVRVFPVEKEDGSCIAYVILLEDVTKLKELDQLKSDFISIASHELRTPMTSIIMSLELVSSGAAGPLNDDQLELLRAADEDARRMRHLMTNLLDISRIETGRLEMDFFNIPPRKIIQDSFNSFHLQSQNQHIEMVEQVEENLPEVRADYNRILQVITNLIGNALRYTPEKGTITLAAKRSNGFIQFGVCDTGQGIPREYLKKIFRKFVQVDGDPKRGGAGLGLALSFEIIKAHKGQIWAESELGKGTRIYFTLPVAKAGIGEKQED